MLTNLTQKLRTIFTTPSQTQTEEVLTFQCNICGHINKDVALKTVKNREAQSCQQCGSSLRMRSVIYALAVELFGKGLILPDFPIDKNIKGVGMSDWEGYADRLPDKIGYTNTFYHQKPKLDIVNIDVENKYDFIISSDVFEHIPPPISIAFNNAQRLLRPGGIFIFTVPYEKEGVTNEYFPDLFDFKIITHNGKNFLFN
ncbi:methyltransferase domain-containing protein, partial [Thiotrichales bacterium HSG1]|nr:methyltransferase domain-containing protein [Thiotrichales bacterium HSG1]